MLSLENTIRGLEVGIAKGGFGANVDELQRSLNSLQEEKDHLQHGSVELIHRMMVSNSVKALIVRSIAGKCTFERNVRKKFSLKHSRKMIYSLC